MEWAILALPWLVATITGWCLLRVVLPASADRAVVATLAPVVGVGLHTLPLYAWTLAFPSIGWPWWLLEGGLTLAAIGAWSRWRQRPDVRTPESAAAQRWLRNAVLIVTLVLTWLVASAAWRESARTPLGDWDAWAMWNAKAQLLFHATPALPLLMTDEFSHADYPLLQPLALARSWRYLGESDWVVPQLFAAVVMGWAVAVMAAGFNALRGPLAGAAAAAALASSIALLRHAPSQYADNTLVLTFAAAIVAWANAIESRDTHGRERWFLVTGLLAGVAMWTKNEGIVLVLAIAGVTLAWMIVARPLSCRRALVAWFIGIAPFVTAVLIHRGLVRTDGTDLLQPHLVGGLLDNLRDPSRYGHVGRAARAAWIQTGNPPVIALLIAAAAVGFTRTRSRLTAAACAFAVCLIQAFAYGAVYLALSDRLSWHLLTSSDRTAMHVWPLLIAAICLALPAYTVYSEVHTESESPTHRAG